MRSLLGILYALGGAAVGAVAGILVALVIIKVANVTSREGASGYLAVAISLIGAAIGLVGGIAWFARSAPAGQTGSYSSAAILGVIGLVALIALGVWARMMTREVALEYGGAQADLEMELRMLEADVPSDVSAGWFDIEVQTSTTRPVGTVLMDKVRTEGNYRIFPVVQGPLFRAVNRVIVVRLGELQTEVFAPPMKRTPDRKADWSAWIRPEMVDPPYGVVPPSPLPSKVELRYRVRVYGE